MKERNVVKSNRCVNSILEKVKPLTVHIPILPNGGSNAGNNEKTAIVSQNTCPFDVLYQIYAAFYKDITQMKEKIDSSRRSFDKFVKNSFEKNIDELVWDRSQLLCAYFPKKVVACQKNLKTIDSFMCMNEMFIVIASYSNVAYSMKTHNICQDCNLLTNKKTLNYVPMQFQGDWKTIIPNLQTYVRIEKTTEDVCKKCSSNLQVHIAFNCCHKHRECLSR